LTQAAGRNPLYVLNPSFSTTFPLHPPDNHLTITTPRIGAANRYPDKVDADPFGTRRLNIDASRSLARLCAVRNILLLYISTDYVFSGRPGEAPYESDAPTGPTNLYGQTKLDGEEAVLGEYREQKKEGLGVVLRVPVLYGSVDREKGNGESAVNCLMDVVMGQAGNGDGGRVVKMDHWALRYPTNTEDVARVCYGGLSICCLGKGLAN
jgi:dTDP-4-dehydrorhamnose reductase